MTVLPYPYPTGTNMTGIVSIMSYVNVVTKGLFGMGVLVAIALISFLTTTVYSYQKALGISSFISFLTALLLMGMNLINGQVFFVSVIYLVIGLIALYVENNQS